MQWTYPTLGAFSTHSATKIHHKETNSNRYWTHSSIWKSLDLLGNAKIQYFQIQIFLLSTMLIMWFKNWTWLLKGQIIKSIIHGSLNLTIAIKKMKELIPALLALVLLRISNSIIEQILRKISKLVLGHRIEDKATNRSSYTSLVHSIQIEASSLIWHPIIQQYKIAQTT